MQTAAGAVLIVLGFLILVFGGVPRRAARPEAPLARARRTMTDLVFRYGMGLACLGFGISLVFQRVSFG